MKNFLLSAVVLSVVLAHCTDAEARRYGRSYGYRGGYGGASCATGHCYNANAVKVNAVEKINLLGADAYYGYGAGHYLPAARGNYASPSKGEIAVQLYSEYLELTNEQLRDNQIFQRLLSTEAKMLGTLKGSFGVCCDENDNPTPNPEPDPAEVFGNTVGKARKIPVHANSCIGCHKTGGVGTDQGPTYNTVNDIWLDFPRAYKSIASGHMPPAEGGGPWTIEQIREWQIEVTP